MDDKKIIELYFARDERAIEETRAKYSRLLLRIASGVLGSHQDSEECESDTYLRAWESIPPNRPEYLAAFLARIVRNLALNRARANRRRASYELAAIYEELDSMGSGDLCEGLDLRAALGDFVSGLDRTKRRIFIQRYFYMMSVGDIAAEQGLSVSGVKTALSRTRKMLRDYLTERGFYL